MLNLRSHFWLAALLVVVTLGAAYLVANERTPVNASSPSNFRQPVNQKVIKYGNPVGVTAVVTIGVTGPLTGGMEWMGWEVVNAAQLAVNDMAWGGINIGGAIYSIVLVAVDDGCNIPMAQAAAQAMIDNKVSVVLGHVCSGSSLAAQPLYAAAGIPMVSSYSTNIHLTDQGYTNTFRVISKDDAPPRLLADYVVRILHVGSASIADADYGGYNPMLGDAFTSTYTSLGGQNLNRHLMASPDAFTTTLQAIALETPDVIYLTETNLAEAVLFTSIAHSLGIDDIPILLNFMTEDRWALDQYSGPLGELALDDVVAMSYRNPTEMPGWTDFSTAYINAFATPPHMFGAFSYDAMCVILAALQQAGSTNPQLVRDALAESGRYSGVVGTYLGFDDQGDVIPQWSWMEQFDGTAWQILTPTIVNIPLARKP